MVLGPKGPGRVDRRQVKTNDDRVICRLFVVIENFNWDTVLWCLTPFLL